MNIKMQNKIVNRVLSLKQIELTQEFINKNIGKFFVETTTGSDILYIYSSKEIYQYSSKGLDKITAKEAIDYGYEVYARAIIPSGLIYKKHKYGK